MISLPDVLHTESGINCLYQAFKYARDTNSDIWEFSVSLKEIGEAGCDFSDLRWLIRKGFVEQKRELTCDKDSKRRFEPAGELIFGQSSCFVITKKGIQFAKDLISNSSCIPSESKISESDGIVDTIAIECCTESPIWEPETHKLLLGGAIVKQFKCPAFNQETVLNAFQEEGWPDRIDDPLVPHPDQNSKRRLADTIKCLNRKQRKKLITFRGDGSGEGIVWEKATVR